MIVNPYPKIIKNSNGSENTYQLIQLDNVSYGFARSPSGYYYNTNNHINNSCSLSRFIFNLLEETTIEFSYLNYAEAKYDYGLIGNIDTALSTAFNDDSNAYMILVNNSSNSIKTFSYIIPSGEHFIDIKYRKDNSNSEYMDTFMIKITNENLIEKSPQEIQNSSYDNFITSANVVYPYRFIGSSGRPEIGQGFKETTSATSNEILSGYTAYSNSGSYITGTYTPPTNSSTINIWSVLNVGTTYGFEKTSDGYYTSTNAGVDSSASLCKVNLQMAEAGTITIQCINYAEANYDYGLIGNIDTILTDAFNDDSNVQKTFKGSSSSNPQSYSFDVSAGEHFIYIKYRKDASQASGNDSFKFKITSGAFEYYMSESNNKSGYEFGDAIRASTGSNISATDLTFTVDTNNLDGFLVIISGDTYINNTDNQIVSIYLNPKDKELNVGLAKYNSSSREVNYYSFSFGKGYYDDIVTMSGSTLQFSFTSKQYYFMMSLNYTLFPIYKT